MTILLVLLSGLRNGDGDRASMNTVPVFVAGLGIGVSSLLTASDFINSQSRRAAMELQSKSAGMIDQPVLFYGAPERFAAAIARPDQIVALPDRLTGEFDVKLIVDALEAGYVVLIAPQFASAPDIAGGEFEIIENPRWADMNLVQVTRR